MMDYILSNLSYTDMALKSINKVLRSQQKINHHISAFMIITSVYVCFDTIQRLEQYKKIEKLSKEIEELKQSEGE